MDHLVMPVNANGFKFQVPLLSTDNYDGGEFFTYPDRQGWGPRTVAEWHGIFEHPSDEFLAFLQRWLYFAYVHITLAPVNVKDTFQSQEVDDLGRPLLTTASLPAVALRALELDSHYSPRSRLGLRDFDSIHLGLSLRQGKGHGHDPQTSQQVEDLRLFIHNYAPSDPRPSCQVLACMLLYEFGNVSTHWGAAGRKQISSFGANVRPDFSRPYLWEALRERGWCPADILPMAIHFNTSALIFMSNIIAPTIRDEHPMIRITQNRSVSSQEELCSHRSCSRRQLSDDTYQTRHVDGCSGCDELVADPTESLNRGFFPLILSIDPSDQKPHINLVDAEPSMPYIAISHVWSDGLGNVKRNALPGCQMDRLSSIIRAIPGKASNLNAFWLDTICVPPDAANQREAQNKALQLMRDVYEKASAVLVMDSWLMSTDSSNMSDIEVLMRIFNCIWNGRLWTFQEGALAQELFFLFKDGSRDLEATFRRAEADLDVTASVTLWPTLASRFDTLRSFRHIPVDRAAQITQIKTAMSFRMTSQASDEALCLATLLNFDLKPSLEQEDALSRMALFWSKTSSVPIDIVQFDGDRMQTVGLQWASRTLLYSPAKGKGRGPPMVMAGTNPLLPPGTLTPRGLQCCLPGFIFDVSDTYLGIMFFIMTHSARAQLVRFIQTHESSLGASNADEERRKIVSPKSEFGTSKIGLVSFQAMQDSNSEAGQYSLASLVVICEENDGVIYCKDLGVTTGQNAADVTEAGFLDDLKPGSIMKSGKRLYAAHVEKICYKQLWCFQ